MGNSAPTKISKTSIIEFNRIRNSALYFTVQLHGGLSKCFKKKKSQTSNLKYPLKFEVSPELLLLNKKTTVAETQEDKRKRNEERERKTVVSRPSST